MSKGGMAEGVQSMMNHEPDRSRIALAKVGLRGVEATITNQTFAKHWCVCVCVCVCARARVLVGVTKRRGVEATITKPAFLAGKWQAQLRSKLDSTRNSARARGTCTCVEKRV